MLLYDYTYDRLFWIVLIFSLVFFILSAISLLTIINNNVIPTGSLFLLSSLWFLSFIFIFMIGYTALLTHPHCRTIIFILYLINLLFLTIWCMQLNASLLYTNISIIMILITGIAVIYFTKFQYLPLGLLFVFIWLYIFYYINTNVNP